nr:head-tail connector protein [Massilia sp. TS11]
MRLAVLLLVGHWYNNREASTTAANVSDIPFGVDALLTPAKVWGF